jgi:hypothetical protein
MDNATENKMLIWLLCVHALYNIVVKVWCGAFTFLWSTPSFISLVLQRGITQIYASLSKYGFLAITFFISLPISIKFGMLVNDRYLKISWRRGRYEPMVESDIVREAQGTLGRECPYYYVSGKGNGCVIGQWF